MTKVDFYFTSSIMSIQNDFFPKKVTPELLALEQSLPVWMLATRWSATYDEYVF